jgi:two-component system sensor kinase FixL
LTTDTLIKIAALSLLYFIFGQLAFVYSLSFGTVTSSIFFPEGIALAFVLLYGVRVSPGVFIGQLALASTTELSLFSSLFISVGNTIEMILGYLILKKIGFNPRLESTKDYLLLVVTIALVMQPFSAGVGCLSMLLFNDLNANDFFNALEDWWVGNVIAQLLLTPTLLAVANFVTRKNIVKFLSIVLILSLVFYLLLNFVSKQWEMHPMHFFSVIFALIIAISVKYNFVGATISNLIIAVIIQSMTIDNIGPFTMGNIQERLVYLNTFIVGIALSSTLVGIALKELKLLNIRYRLILNSAGEGIYGIDLDGQTTFANPAAEEMLGYTEEDLLGKPQYAIIHHSKPDGSPYSADDCYIYAAIKDGKVHRESEEVFWRKDSTSFPVEYVSTPILENDDLKGAVVVFKDITDKKFSENLTSRLGRILDNSFNEIYLFNAENFKFIQANKGAYNNLNYSHKEMLQLTPLDLKPEFTKEAFEEMVRPLRSKEKSLVVFDTLHKRKDGTIYPVEIRLQLMANETPQVFIAVVQDITQRKQAEEKIKTYYSELEKANEELQSFSSIASHDLQEPLRKIIAFGDRLESSIPASDERGKDYLERMQKSAIRMRTLVEDLLQYTRVETKARLFESVDLNKVVETVLDDLETRISETKGAVNITELPVIDADPVQMHQLFLNLIGNALKFHRKGDTPVVNLSRVKKGNGFWEISVEDNGIGIDEEHIDKIFKPFERLHGRTTYEGTGIGLTICNKIVSRHGGTIAVKRQSTNGVTFHITLPEKQVTAK